MDTVSISVINRTSMLQEKDITPVLMALASQANHEFAAEWGTPQVKFTLVPKGQLPSNKTWWMVLGDTSDQLGALGYHDVTASDYPLMKVFVRTTMDAGDAWSVTCSHELLEALVDPTCCGCVGVTHADGTTVFMALEVGDPVEADEFGYERNGVLLSNWVTKAWFDPSRKVGPFDYRGILKKPFALASGGYVAELRAKESWTQTLAKGSTPRYLHRAALGSRRERRRTPREYWVRSTAPGR